MNQEPDKNKLKDCIDAMALAMKMEPLPNDLCFKLIDHVLYNQDYDGIEGKNGWQCFKQKLLTEREIRNLLMAHSATKIARFNKIKEPGCDTYTSMKLCQGFEVALIGRHVNPTKIDVLDPWEKMNNK